MSWNTSSIRILKGVALTLVVALLVPAAAMAVDSRISNGAIYARANSYANGQWGGQCKAYVQTVFNAVAASVGSPMRIGSGYYTCYQSAGGVPVSSAAAARGDIIQVYEASAPNSYYPGMHSAIVVNNLGNGVYDVIDSNWGYDEKVQRHRWDVRATLAKYPARELAIWRLGTTSTPAPTRPTVVVDETAARFYGPSQYWWTRNIGYNGQMKFTYNTYSTIGNYAVWRPNLAGGNYEVYAYIPGNYATTTRAQYTIVAANLCGYRTINQYNISNAWVSLGTYSFSAGTGGYVRLDDRTGEANYSRMVGVDAVKFVPR